MMPWLWMGWLGCGGLFGATPEVPAAPPEHTRCDAIPAELHCYLPVPGGTFRMGAQAEDPQAPNYDVDALPDESPVHEVRLPPFWMQKHEYAISMYARCVSAGACSLDDVLTEGVHATYGHKTDFDLPVVGVTHEGAVRGCAFIGGRLPTEAEWAFAARGSTSRKFPWGDKPACGVADRSPTGTWTEDQPESTECTSSSVRVPAELRGVSPFEVVGMGGNAWEWVADGYDPEGYAKHAAVSPMVAGDGTLMVQRGGGWTEPTPDGLRAAARQGVPGDAKLFDVGFRCVWAGTEAPGLEVAQPVEGTTPPPDGPLTPR